MAYCLAADVKSQAIQNAITQASMDDTAVGVRITEADSIIDGRLAALGYTVPFSTVHPMIKNLSIYWARYAILRDIYGNNSPSNDPDSSAKHYKDLFDELMDKISEGEFDITVATTGVVVTREPDHSRIDFATSGVDRIATMNDPESEGTVPAEYYDTDVVGD